MQTDYATFLQTKQKLWTGIGHVADELPSRLFDWQDAIVRWALKKGRCAIFADTGLGKTGMQVSWAHALGVKTIIFAPLCVAEQTVAEAALFGIRVVYARNQAEALDCQIVITNYERIDAFDLSQFEAVVLDESSILKAFDGKTRTKLIEVCRRVKYRLCCTATPSPNDIAELGNHAEFLGLMTQAEFHASWFIHDKSGWRMKKHAVVPFYRWMASWAIALRTPKDLGYDDSGYVLPPLVIEDHIIRLDGPTGDMLFPEMSTKGLTGRLSARRGSLEQRTEKAAEIVGAPAPGHDGCQWMIWCGLNPESDAIASLIPGSVNVQGKDKYEEKVSAVQLFASGAIRYLISKTSILGYGLNFQHSHHAIFCGLGDSFEQYYQAVRRQWRFGQTSPVTAHVIISEAEQVVVENVRRKEAKARDMAAMLISHMADFEKEELISA